MLLDLTRAASSQPVDRTSRDTRLVTIIGDRRLEVVVVVVVAIVSESGMVDCRVVCCREVLLLIFY